jgi:hypothetical protein
MRRILSPTRLAVVALVLGVFALASPAQAQFIQVYSPPVYVAPPTVSYYTPVTTYAAPVYRAPVTSYYTPAVTYSYYPSTTVYSAPAYTTYSAPAYTTYAAPAAVVAPGTVTTRSFVGYGIFRPRGVYTQSYYTPGAVVAPTTTYYAPY